MIPQIRRYLSCIVNLIWLRLVLLLLGFFRFECENYRYFDKMERMMIFKSGWVGVAVRQSLVEFLYYGYLFNPTFCRVVEYYEDGGEDGEIGEIQKKSSSNIINIDYPNPNTSNNRTPPQPTTLPMSTPAPKPKQAKLFYTPLSFKQAFFAALTLRGFDPIIVRGKHQFKRLKRRKMPMSVLIAECFEELNGPILVFLPSLGYREVVAMHYQLGCDMFDNQRRFDRSGIIFQSQIQQPATASPSLADSPAASLSLPPNRTIPPYTRTTHLHQLPFLLQLCSELRPNILTITATETKKYKYEYQREGYAEFVDEVFGKGGWVVRGIGIEGYMRGMDQVVRGLGGEVGRMDEEDGDRDKDGDGERILMTKMNIQQPHKPHTPPQLQQQPQLIFTRTSSLTDQQLQQGLLNQRRRMRLYRMVDEMGEVTEIREVREVREVEKKEVGTVTEREMEMEMQGEGENEIEMEMERETEREWDQYAVLGDEQYIAAQTDILVEEQMKNYGQNLQYRINNQPASTKQKQQDPTQSLQPPQKQKTQ